jgi:hypothetical protein
MPKRNSKFQPFTSGVGGGGKWYFLKKTRPKSPHHEEKKNLKPPYVNNRFQNYDLHSLCKGNSKISDFPLSPFAKFSQALFWRITKLTASQISNTKPVHNA